MSQEDKEKTVSVFLRGAMIVIPAVMSFVMSIGSIVWVVGMERAERLLLQEKLETAISERQKLEGEVETLKDLYNSQAVAMGRLEEKLINIESTGKETLELFRDYTRDR